MKIAFYSCFFGADSNHRNKIPTCPSKTDCFFFTNNPNTYAQLENTCWTPIFINIPIKNNLTADAMDAKHLKACPYMYPELNGYDVTCYFDSALSTSQIQNIVNRGPNTNLVSGASMGKSKNKYLSTRWFLQTAQSM